jgi:ABC-type polysaccharide/polyol phosphate transport system ATPase subunit
MRPLIELRDVSLSVPIYVQQERRVRNWASLFLSAGLDPPRRVTANLLEGVSMVANENDRIAILGRNGAGKSTLLRVLNGVYAPTSGEVTVNGSRQALLNISLGFNNEATVRENIFLRGTAMGLRIRDLREHIDSILEFASLEEKSSHRLRTLSAGQRTRLGFAISTTFQHDIMLMDEWVGTGDAQFMAKAKNRLIDRMGGSKVVVLASHSVGLLRDVCNQGVVIEQGRLVHAGNIGSALAYYHELMQGLTPQIEVASAEGEVVYGCAEQIAMRNGHVELVGWLTSTGGATAQGLVLEVNGVHYPVDRIERRARQDVARHFGLRDRQCGFNATFAVPGVVSVTDLGRDLRVLGGMHADQARSQLRIAPAVTAALREGATDTSIDQGG